jgi:membrane fusion protein (multidrug efflux system)
MNKETGPAIPVDGLTIEGSRAFERPRRKTVLATLILGVAAVAGASLIYVITSAKPETGQPSKQERPPVVKVVAASNATVSLGLELTGAVEPYQIARLASPAEGPVFRIRVREGDRVKAGDALLSIGRKKGADALIFSLQEKFKKEEDNLRRTEQLVGNGTFPVKQLDQAKADYEDVRAQLVKAEETAQDYAITAPWAGVVSQVLVKEGEFVAPRVALLEMYDPSSLVIRVAVPEKHAATVSTDMCADIRLDAYPGEILKGRIERIYPYLDPRLRTRTVEIVLDKPVDLLPGMFARVKVLLKVVNDAVVVPAEAVVSTPKGQAIFVVEEGKAVRTPVETGIEEGNRIQIVTGIKPGDKVVVAGNEKLKDGAAVSLSGGEGAGKGTPSDKGESPADPMRKAGGEGK